MYWKKKTDKVWIKEHTHIRQHKNKKGKARPVTKKPEE